MFFINLSFCSVALVLLALVTVEAEHTVNHGHMLADTEIALKQPVTHTAHVRALRSSP